MYHIILFIHTLVRWILLIGLLYAIYRAYKGYITRAAFSKMDNAVRHWTATVSHIQLVIGITLYTQSPVVQYFWKHPREAISYKEPLFFGLIHILLMVIAVGVLTTGSAMAKRQLVAREQFRVMLVWFVIALVIIFIAIPWPFSPLSNRPYIRSMGI